MYDPIDDPYTYENSTVLVNKLNLRDQGELDDFEAEISSAPREKARLRHAPVPRLANCSNVT
jgi:cell filamentation protein